MRALRIGTVWPADDGDHPATDAPPGLADLVAAAAREHGWSLGGAERTGGTGWAGLTWLGEADDGAPSPAPGVAPGPDGGPATAPDATRGVARLRAAAAELGVDLALTTGALATDGPELVITDVDSTFIAAESIDLLAARAGAGAEVAAVTESAMRGEIDFAESLRRRLLTLEGLPTTVFDGVRAEATLMPGAADLVAALHARGARVGLVSGGFVEIVGPLAAGMGIDLVAANTLEAADGALTGRSTGEVVDAAAKARTLRTWTHRTGADPARVVAVGDGANDLEMLAAAGLGVAFCAKPVVQAAAAAAVRFPRLDAVLGLLGLSARVA